MRGTAEPGPLNRRDKLFGMTRRQAVASLLALPVAAAARPAGPVVDTHVHLFAADTSRFPLAPNATYKPETLDLETYVRFATAVGIDHTVIVHPEPYQDNHRYLEYCFAHEPSKNFFKGTCLFDPIARNTPDRMAELVGANPGRIVALRIHETHAPGTPSLASGPIKDRDLTSPQMKMTWKRAQQLKLAIQMHFLPYYAPQIYALAEQFPAEPVILDHLGRSAQGTPAEFAGVLRLAKLPRVYIKFSEVQQTSKDMVRRVYDAFGPDRMLWGYFGHDKAAFEKNAALLDEMFSYATEADRSKIRGGNALKLFGW